MSALLSVDGETHFQQEIRKSRFLAQAAPVDGPDAALAFFARVGVRDASHNCWAYRVGEHYRFNDDGEPGGSAGRPILHAIDCQNVDRVAVVVTRWFGGIKLGVGGLVRAYGGCAAECLRRAGKREMVERARAKVHCDFSAAPTLYARLREFDARRVGELALADGVELELDVSRRHLDALGTFVRDLTRGRGSVKLSS